MKNLERSPNIQEKLNQTQPFTPNLNFCGGKSKYFYTQVALGGDTNSSDYTLSASFESGGSRGFTDSFCSGDGGGHQGETCSVSALVPMTTDDTLRIRVINNALEQMSLYYSNSEFFGFRVRRGRPALKTFYPYED